MPTGLQNGQDWGSPLFVSQYLPNNAAQAKQLSRVNLGWPHDNYAGYITVNTTTFSNMFFWVSVHSLHWNPLSFIPLYRLPPSLPESSGQFFPAQNGDAKSPVLLWLQGGWFVLIRTLVDQSCLLIFRSKDLVEHPCLACFQVSNENHPSRLSNPITYFKTL